MAESHADLLKVHCRLCGQKRIDTLQNRGVLVKNHPQLCRFLRFLHEIEADRESEEIYPTRACDACISRLRNVSICQENTTKKLMDNVFELATKLHTEGQDDEMRKLAREFPAADFWACQRHMCAICDDSHKDTFSVPDYNSHLIIELANGPNGLQISQCKKTAKPIAVPTKRPAASQAQAKIKDGLSSNEEMTVVNVAKKAKIEDPVVKPKAAISSGQAWMEFIEALGRNRYDLFFLFDFEFVF